MNGLKKVGSFVSYIFYLVIIVLIIDVAVLRNFYGFGYHRDYKEDNIQRFPAPYVMFTGKPNEGGHNELGFLGPSLKDAGPGDFTIAFFGGSTGYMGEPPIAKVIETELKKILNVNVFVANYSVVGSNHRQHLHGILEYLPNFKPDLVIFYGGYNETISSAYYDPRPGYPYNFFYRAETSPFMKLLIQNSSIVGELDKKYGWFTGLDKLRMMQQPFSDSWNNRIADKYFETIELANTVASSMESHHCGKTKFLSFYQPYQVPKEFQLTHEKIKRQVNALEYALDVSSEFDTLGNNVFVDIVHVKQEANDLMGKRIAIIIAEKLRKGGLSDCRLSSN
jgi:hypothetical protein